MDFSIQMFSIMLPIMFGVMAAFFLILGLRGILTRTPYLLSNRWLLLVMFFAYVPSIIMPFFFSIYDMDLMDWLNPAIFTVVLVMMFFALRGYTAYGITDTTFREVLLAALEKLQLPYEESLSSMRLTSIDADLQFAIQSWLGSGVIKIKQRKHRSVLSEIAAEMNRHFRLSSGPIKLVTFIFYVIMGVLMIIGGIGMLYLFNYVGDKV